MQMPILALSLKSIAKSSLFRQRQNVRKKGVGSSIIRGNAKQSPQLAKRARCVITHTPIALQNWMRLYASSSAPIEVINREICHHFELGSPRVGAVHGLWRFAQSPRGRVRRT